MEILPSNRSVKKDTAPVSNPRWTQPSIEFAAWWEPHDFDQKLGSIGGHHDARRCIVNLHGEKVWLGVSTLTAWNCQRYRDEFQEARMGRVENHGQEKAA